MNRRSGGIFDVITVIFLVLSLVVFLIALGMIGHIVPVPAALRPASPTIIATIVIPTDTQTAIPTETDTPTRTETPTRTSSPTQTATATGTITQTPSDTLVLTDTDVPTDAPTAVPDTNTPTSVPATATRIPTRTRTATKTKVGAKIVAATKTPAGFPFALGPGSPSLTANLDTATGCAFQGIAGQVFGLNNEALTGLQINVTGPNGFSQTASTGSNPRYGQSGWQVQIDNKINNNTYTVELRSTEGVPLSDKITVSFTNSCQSNLALLNLVETRPY